MISYSNELAEYSKAWNNLSSKIELTIKYIMNEHKVKELDLTDSEFFGHFYDYIDYVYKTYQVTGIYIDYEDCLVIETNNGEIEPSEMSLIDLTALIKEVLNVLDED